MNRSRCNPPDWPRCHWCGTNPETMNLAEAIQLLSNCNNCHADINMNGQWTGYGGGAVIALAKRFGIDAVNAAWMGNDETKYDAT